MASGVGIMQVVRAAPPFVISKGGIDTAVSQRLWEIPNGAFAEGHAQQARHCKLHRSHPSKTTQNEAPPPGGNSGAGREGFAEGHGLKPCRKGLQKLAGFSPRETKACPSFAFATNAYSQTMVPKTERVGGSHPCRQCKDGPPAKCC